MHYSTNTADMGVGVTTRTVLRWNSCLSKIWLYAGITEYLFSTHHSTVSGSENLTVQSISRKDWCKPESSETTCQTLTLRE